MQFGGEGYAKMVRYIIDGIKAKLGLLEDEPAEILIFVCYRKNWRLW